MIDDDFGRLCGLLDTVAELRQRAPQTTRAKRLFQMALRPYSYEAVEAAVVQHLRDGSAGTYTSALQPAHIIAAIEAEQKDDKRPAPDEAWAIAMASLDEAQTVVWTQETAEAMGTCRALLNARDFAGARMAFRAAYDRCVQAARSRREPVRWIVSLGRDLQLQQTALAEAQRIGRVSKPHLKAILPPPEAAANEPILLATAGTQPDGEDTDPDPGVETHAVDQMRQLRDLVQNMLIRRQRNRRLSNQRRVA